MISELCLGCMTFGRELDEGRVVRLPEASVPAALHPYGFIRNARRV